MTYTGSHRAKDSTDGAPNSRDRPSDGTKKAGNLFAQSTVEKTFYTDLGDDEALQSFLARVPHVPGDVNLFGLLEQLAFTVSDEAGDWF